MNINSMSCPNCGLNVAPGQQFCPRCKRPLITSPNWQGPYIYGAPTPSNQPLNSPNSGPGPNNSSPPGIEPGTTSTSSPPYPNGNTPGPPPPYPPGNEPGPYSPYPPGIGPDNTGPITTSSTDLPVSRKIAATIISVCCVLAALALILYMKRETWLPRFLGSGSGIGGSPATAGEKSDSSASGDMDLTTGQETATKEKGVPSDSESSENEATSPLPSQEEYETAQGDKSEEGKTTLAETEPEETAVEETEEEYAERAEPVSGLMDIDSLKSIANAKSSKAVYSTCIYDFTTNKYSGSSNYQTAMSSSVLIDIPILYAVAVMEEQNLLSLDDRITFHYTTDGRGELKKSDDGKLFTIRNLLSIMFRSSDNNVTNTFLNFFGYESIEDICHMNGYSSVKIANLIGKTTDYTSNDNYISAYDLCMMSRELYSDRYYIGKQFLESYMVVTDSAGLEGIGRDISYSHFMNINGVKKEKFNELAIVENGDKTYIVAFLSNSDKLETLESIAAAFGNHINNILK